VILGLPKMRISWDATCKRDFDDGRPEEGVQRREKTGDINGRKLSTEGGGGEMLLTSIAVLKEPKHTESTQDQNKKGGLGGKAANPP